MLQRYFVLLSIVWLVSCDSEEKPVNKKASVQKTLDAYTEAGLLPGVVLYVSTPDYSWYFSSGFRDRENDIRMDTLTLGYPQSISKSFTAVAVLKLQEAGRLDVDDKMNEYLSADLCDHISNGNEITIRQLLNHTSGVVDYVWIPEFQADVLSGALFPMTIEKVLSYVYDKPALFSPGTDFAYADTNYHLLAMIMDEVTGEHHGAYFQSAIMDPLSLNNTWYLPYSSPDNYDGKSYYFTSNHYEDVTETQFKLTAGGIGGDGLLCEAKDLAVFYRALLGNGALLNESSLSEMKTGVITGVPYGMGLMRVNFGRGGVAFGHDGGGMGGGGMAYYFPDKSITIVMLTNTGLLTDKAQVVEELWTRVLFKVL